MEFTTQINFVVAYFPQISATKLKIPAHFSELHEFVTMRDKYKNTWKVKARKVDGHWYLLDGWAKFVADSSVTMMDVLDFHYFGPSSLDVYIPDIHGDVKKGVGYRKIDNPIEYLKIERDESEHVYTSARMSLGKGKKLTKFNRGKAKGSTSRPAPTPKIPSSAAKPPRRMNDTNNKGKGIMKESSDEDSDSNSDSDSDFWPYDFYDEISEDDIVSWISGLENSKKHKLKARGAKVPKRAKHGSGKFDYLGNKIFESGVIPRPTCTYFVTKMKPATPDELHIPEEIARDENLQLPETITLADPKGNAYRSSSLTSRTDGVMIYKGGWKLLCWENNLTGDDYCICEFGEGIRPATYTSILFV